MMVKRSKVEYASMNADLPEEIIHHILSKLPTDGTITKELGRLSLISKRWLTACSSYNVVDFIGTCSNNTPQDVQKTQQLITYLDKTISNYTASSNSLHKFRLHIDFTIFSDLPTTKEMNIRDESFSSALPPLLDKWINIALDKCVQNLDLQIRFRCIYWEAQEKFGIAKSESISKDTESFKWRYRIPTRVLSSDFVKSLKLGWQVCLPRSLISSDGDGINMAALPLSKSLRSLELFRVNKDIDNQAFERLIQGCPAIEELIIDSQYINEIKVSGLHHLKKISIRRYITETKLYEGVRDFYIKVEAPSLESLCFLDNGRGKEERQGYYSTNLDVDCCNLKCLKLIRDLSLDADKFDRLVSKFPILESLELEDCSLINEIDIRNPMMKKIELKFGKLWSGFKRVVISSPNVLHLRYECTSGIRFPSIWVSEYNRPKYVEAVFKDTQPIYLFPYWFRNLRESMVRVSSNHTSLSFNYTWKKECGEEKVLVPTK